MRKTIFLVGFFLVSVLANGQSKKVYLFSTFHEPANEGLLLATSRDGYHWEDLGGPYLKPEIGTQKVMRDPSVAQGPDGTFHLVWTSSWKGDLGFGYSSTKDFIHWTAERMIPVMAYDTTTVNVWAPELFYDDENKDFVIVWASTVPFKFAKGEEEELNNHRLYYTRTKDFVKFTKTKLFFDPGYSVIDAMIVKRGKSDFVLVVKDNTRNFRNIKVAFGKSPVGPWRDVSAPFTPFKSEGPTVAKVGQDYLIYYDSYGDKKYGAMKTSDFKTFTDVSSQVYLPAGHKHGTIFMVDEEIVTALKNRKSGSNSGEDVVHYTGKTLNNPDYHHGQLSPVVGVHNIQVLRANREHPEMADGFGWTYNHAPMLVNWNHTFYLEYLSDSVGEHTPPGHTLLVTSKDGYHWGKPAVLFPVYRVPDGTTQEGQTAVAKNLFAVMHQRMGFYLSEEQRLLAFGYYGICLNPKDGPNDGNGIGRVVREIYKDGTFGPIYFIRYNHGFSEKNTDFPFFTRSRDKEFVKICNRVLADPLQMEQWIEEADRDDPLVPLKGDYQATCYYHLPDGRVVGLWKHALTAISTDEGKTWPVLPQRAPGFVNNNAKIWGQRTSDGKYATVYNPSDFRWPLAISVSDNGLDYKNLLLVNGEITTMRYGGSYKSYGPQYVRGIQERNGQPADGKLWVTYSMNKEDIWVSSIPVPVKQAVTEPVQDVFNEMPEGKELENWNIYSPVLAGVGIEKRQNIRGLMLRDKDEFDYAMAQRIFPASEKINVEFTVTPGQNSHGTLFVELQNEKNTAAMRLVFDSDGNLKNKAGYRMSNLMKYQANQKYTVRIEAQTSNRFFTVYVDGKKQGTGLFFAPVASLQQLVFRTGEVRRFPTVDTPTDQDFDVKQSGKPIPEATYWIESVKCAADAGAKEKTSEVILKSADFKHYADYFNRMEDENIVQAIPNTAAWDLMKENIPLFECPQDNFNEIYYYRWWTLRKHLKQTPSGYAFTEFLINRSYADKYNLISSALGHHIMEARWLRDQKYLDQYIQVWLRGNDGKPMEKLHKFSSWLSYAVWQKYLADGDVNYLIDLLPDLKADYANWEKEQRLKNGLFWSFDVRDGMEEQISGGRKVKNARPTINSYMFGNADALSKMAAIAGDIAGSKLFRSKADTLKRLIEEKLWNPASSFYETVKEDGTFAQVREEIGFIPWYFNLPAKDRVSAWENVKSEKGFLAPFGLTTAERSHPQFRTHGCCKCEWDGAVWPFATSQTLTGMANLLNGDKQSAVNDSIYFRFLELYVESQYKRGRPYVGEYLDEKTGAWLKGDEERSRYYNHSTFNDLIISGLIGLRPNSDNQIEVNPLVPAGKWDWFCLDNLPYHGKLLTICWDREGSKYHRGKGLFILVDGKEVGRTARLQRITCKL